MSFNVEEEASEFADEWASDSEIPVMQQAVVDLLNRAIEATEEECIGDVCLTCLAAQYGTRKSAELFIDRGIETWAHFGADESFTYCDAARIHERRRRREEK